MPKVLPQLIDAPPVCCAPIGSTPEYPENDAMELAVRLKALADPVRLKLIAHLLGQPNYCACTCDLAPVLGISESTASHHLKTLEKAGLLSKYRQGLNVHYAANIVALQALGSAVSFQEFSPAPSTGSPCC